MKNSFYLVIPKQQKNPQRLKEFDEKALQNWIAELPTANAGLATRLIHDFLVELNTLEMGHQLRLDTLELLRPSVLIIEDYLRSRLIKSGFPKEENDTKILNVLVSIEQEFAIGYWTVLKGLTRSAIGWFQGKSTAVALQRCIKGLSNIVVSHFVMGVAVPDWVWLDLHSFYKLSVQLKKDTVKIANDASQPSKASSPEECYRQILLLSLADPTGLMQKEIQLTYDFIGTIAYLINFRDTPVPGQDRQCIILTDEDKPPFYTGNLKSAGESSALYIDFSKLHKAFEHKEKLFSTVDARFSSVQITKSAAEKPSAELLDYLDQRWSGVDLSGEPLFSDRLDRLIAVGLEATFELLNPQSSSDEKDLEFLVQSESERLLSCVFNQTGVMSVGSLVSFRKKDTPRHIRSLGVVDKVVVTKQNGKIIFGMQLLATSFITATYQQDGAGADKKCLYYSHNTPNSEGSIITDTFILKDEDVIRLTLPDEEFPVSLKNRKNVGLGYWQFECTRTEGPKITTPPKKGYDFI